MQDIGIEYNENYYKNRDKYIKYLGKISENSFLFLEKESCIHILNFLENTNKFSETFIKLDKKVDYMFGNGYNLYGYSNEDKTFYSYIKEGNYLYRLDKLFSLYKNESVLHAKIIEKIIIVSTNKLRIIFFDLEKLEIVKIIFLSENHFIEPYWFEVLNNNNLLVVDPSAQCVYELNENGDIIWSYGSFDNPGSEEGKLFIPVSAFKYKGNYYISEQRNHRVICINIDKKIVKIFGNTSIVGHFNNGFWAPFILDLKNDSMKVVECKGANIHIIKVDLLTKKMSSIYGKPIIEHSIFNFPRILDWSAHFKLLAVADSGNNEIKIFNENNKLLKIISKIDGVELQFPRYVKWNNNELLITDSKNKRLIIYNYLKDKIFSVHLKLEDDILKSNNWLQSAVLSNNYILVSISNRFLLYDRNKNIKKIDSKITKYQFKDIHSVEFEDDGNFLVADTGNNKCLKIFKNGKIIIVDKILLNDKEIYLKKPRFFIKQYGMYIIVDSGSSKIYIINDLLERKVVKYYGGSRGISFNRLSLPRCAILKNENTIYISDTDNHRILLRKI